MTVLKRKVEREFASPSWNRKVILEFDPAGYIRLREKRCRRKYSISVEALFFLLVRESGDSKPRPKSRKRGFRF